MIELQREVRVDGQNTNIRYAKAVDETVLIVAQNSKCEFLESEGPNLIDWVGLQAWQGISF